MLAKNKIPKGIVAGFILTGLLFIVLYLILSVHNRPAADDFYFLHSVNKVGLWNTMVAAYNAWITRWASLLFLGGAIITFHPGSFIWYHLFSLVCLIAATTFLLKRILEVRFNTQLSFRLILIYALIFVISFFMIYLV